MATPRLPSPSVGRDRGWGAARRQHQARPCHKPRASTPSPVCSTHYHPAPPLPLRGEGPGLGGRPPPAQTQPLPQAARQHAPDHPRHPSPPRISPPPRGEGSGVGVTRRQHKTRPCDTSRAPPHTPTSRSTHGHPAPPLPLRGEGPGAGGHPLPAQNPPMPQTARQRAPHRPHHPWPPRASPPPPWGGAGGGGARRAKGWRVNTSHAMIQKS
jgi:hypothetical protein